MLPLTAVLHGSALDARRGVVRLHPEAMAALGIAPWDPVLLTGTRTTAALAAYAPPTSAPQQALCDELVLGNLAVRDGAAVTVAAAAEQGCRTLVLAGPPEVVAAVDPALLRTAMLGKVVTTGDDVSLVPQDLAPVGPPDPAAARRSLKARLGMAAGTVLLRVVEAEPASSLVTMATVVGWRDGTSTTGSATPVTADAAAAPRVADLPGLEAQARALHEWLDLGFAHPDLLARLGTAPAMGVLVTGAAGSGKAALVGAVAAEVGARLVRAWGPELAGLEVNAAADRLRALLTPATSPTVVLVEDVEALVPREGAAPLAATFQQLVRSAVEGGRLAVVCTTARPEQVDPALRAPGVLDHEVAVPLPDRAQRRRLLDVATGRVPLDPDADLDGVAARTPGFVAADVLALVREAGLRAAARQRAAEHPVVAQEDFEAALEVVRPTALQGAPLDLGGLTLDDVGDMAEVKAALTETVLWPLQYPDTFARLGVTAPHGALLYGPPGCGKTFLVKAIAGSGQANVLSVKGAELLSKWVGESEAAVRELFRRARETAPSLVFLDEVDALAPRRGGSTDGGTTDRVVAALLTELDGVESLRDVVVVGATNRPDLIDPALLRPGRLERLVFVPPPDAEARAAVLRAASRDVPLSGVDLDDLGRRTDGFSAADCAALVREAALTAMRASMSANEVTAEHVEAALRVVRPSLDPAQVAELAAYAERREQR